MHTWIGPMGGILVAMVIYARGRRGSGMRLRDVLRGMRRGGFVHIAPTPAPKTIEQTDDIPQYYTPRVRRIVYTIRIQQIFQQKYPASYAIWRAMGVMRDVPPPISGLTPSEIVALVEHLACMPYTRPSAEVPIHRAVDYAHCYGAAVVVGIPPADARSAVLGMMVTHDIARIRETYADLPPAEKCFDTTENTTEKMRLKMRFSQKIDAALNAYDRNRAAQWTTGVLPALRALGLPPPPPGRPRGRRRRPEELVGWVARWLPFGHHLVVGGTCGYTVAAGGGRSRSGPHHGTAMRAARAQAYQAAAGQ